MDLRVVICVAGAFLYEDIRNAFCLGLGESGPGSSEVGRINE